MAYINTETNEYPLYEGDIRLAYPEMGEEFILPTNYAEVEVLPIPEHGPEEEPIAEPIKNINGKWVQEFRIERISEEQLYKMSTYPVNKPDKRWIWNELDKIWEEEKPFIIEL